MIGSIQIHPPFHPYSTVGVTGTWLEMAGVGAGCGAGGVGRPGLGHIWCKQPTYQDWSANAFHHQGSLQVFGGIACRLWVGYGGIGCLVTWSNLLGGIQDQGYLLGC